MSAAVTYHVGMLANDRATNADLDKVARQWMDAAEDGRAHLLQRRIEAGRYEYLAHAIEPAETLPRVRDRDGLGLPDKLARLPGHIGARSKAA